MGAQSTNVLPPMPRTPENVCATRPARQSEVGGAFVFGLGVSPGQVDRVSFLVGGVAVY
jgi:hypothetical protein